MHPYVHSSTVHNSQDMETTSMSINRWMDKVDVVHIYNGILPLSHKKEWNNVICSNMNATRDYHTKWSQKETNTIWYHLHVESKTWHNWSYLQNRKRLTDIENRLVVATGEGGGRGMNWEFEVGRCKLLHVEWINNKVLLNSTGNYIQSPGTNHNGKEYKKRMYMFV